MADKKKLYFRDRAVGSVSISDNKRKYFKTKDSTSPSGHSLVAQIDMTHSGIVTRNYGFYLPSRMKDGARTFTQDYAKPVIIGHDENPLEETSPVGRVIDANYISTADSFIQNDKYLKKLFQFEDSFNQNSLDFVNYVIQNYDGKDNYAGLGHIRGTLKISDKDAIEKILDERYLTVSTSMISDSARCSVCGTDWVQSGPCEHHRGGVYDDKVCVLVPGHMAYDHLGIVNAPADPHANGFNIVGLEANATKLLDSADEYKIKDDYQVAINLFAWSDSGKTELVSLNVKEDVNLIEVKDSIQKMENAMAKKKTTKVVNDTLASRIKDAIDVSISMYRYSSEGKNPRSISMSEYMQELDDSELSKMVEGMASMMSDSATVVTDQMINDAVVKYFDDAEEFVRIEDATGEEDSSKEGQQNDSTEEEEDEGKESKDQNNYAGKKKKKKKTMDNFKLVETEDEISEESMADAVKTIKEVEGVELTDAQVQSIAEQYVLCSMGDAIATLTYGSVESVEMKDFVATFLAQEDKVVKLSDCAPELLREMINKHIAEDKQLSDEDFGKLKASDFCGMKGCFPVVDKAHYLACKAVLGEVIASDSIKGRILGAIERKADKLGLDLSDSFDNNSDSCDNDPELSIEDLVKLYNDTKTKLVEAGYEFEDSVPTETLEEVEILEAQLEAANEEVEDLQVMLDSVKVELVESLAERVVDLKVLSGNFSIEDRAEALKEHTARSVESLRDSLKDLNGQVNLSSITLNDGLASGAPEVNADDVQNPVLGDDKVTKVVKKNSDVSKDKIYDSYRHYVQKYGKKEADKWLDRVMKKNGTIPSLD